MGGQMRLAPRVVRAMVTQGDNLEGAVATWFDNAPSKHISKT